MERVPTDLATLKLVERVLPALRDKKYALWFFLEFSACFDTLSRDILYDKLYRYGVRGAALNLIESYFDNPRQYLFIYLIYFVKLSLHILTLYKQYSQ